MDVAFIGEFKDGKRVFREVAASRGIDGVVKGGFDPLEETYCRPLVMGEIPNIIGDSHAIPFLFGLSATARMGIRTYMGVPIRLSDGSLFGTFCCYSSRPSKKPRADDTRTLQLFADMIGSMLEDRIIRERDIDQKNARISAVIERSAISVVYQPIVGLSTGRAVGYEALARFASAPQQGPDRWFADAHEINRGAELERRAIELALQGLDQLEPEAYLSLNVSTYSLLNDKFAAYLISICSPRLVLEVTEHIPVEEYDPLVQRITLLRQSGFRLAIDDAGSGYASFRHILRLQPDIIKLDQSLIHNIDRDGDRRALATALIRFAADTGANIVAEGVETPQELQVLVDLGVETAQGFLIGLPKINGFTRAST